MWDWGAYSRVIFGEQWRAEGSPLSASDSGLPDIPIILFLIHKANDSLYESLGSSEKQRQIYVAWLQLNGITECVLTAILFDLADKFH